MSLIHRISQLYNLLLPPTCILCGYYTHGYGQICLPCQKDLPILPQHCVQCAQFIHFSPEIEQKCGECLRSPPSFQATYALFPYTLPIIQLIIRLKFQHQLSHANVFSDLFITRMKRWYQEKPLPDVLIPIPLHPKRLRERGFNQALEIAKPIAKAFHIALDVYGVKRVKATLPQSILTPLAREQNVKHAFSTMKSYKGLKVAVLDDVMTTGYTMEACCKILKQNGAERIEVWCCARR